MPIKSKKTPELLQAQIATFAAERVEHYKDKGHLLAMIGKLALQEANNMTRVTTSVEYHNGEDGEYSMRVPEGTERKVATSEDYTEFLRSVGGSQYEPIRGRADILEEYSSYRQDITELREELASLEAKEAHPAYLGSGSNAMVFSISKGEKKYAVRIPSRGSVPAEVIDSHLAGAVLGKGVPQLEQIVAASYEDGVTVAEMMPGKEIGQLSTDDINGITDRQLEQLVDTLVTAHERGIEIDPKPSNIFYDPEEGYGVVDYHSSKVAGKSSADQSLGTIVGWMGAAIDNTGFYGKPFVSKRTAEDYAQTLALSKANLEVMTRFRVIVEQKLIGDDLQEALRLIDERLEGALLTVKNYSDPAWVDRQIFDEQERSNSKAAHPGKTAFDAWSTIDLT